MTAKPIFFVILILLLACIIYCSCSKKERYADLWYNGDLNNTMLQRPTFNSNLDPKNPNMRFDSNVYGGFIKGASPPVGYLASNNLQSGEPLGPKESIQDLQTGRNNAYTSIERFAPVLSGSYNGPVGNQTAGNSVSQGTYQAGMNDAAQYVNYSDFANAGSGYQNDLTSTNKKMQLNNVLNLAQGNNLNPASNEYQVQGTDFAYLATPGTVKQQEMQATRKYKASLDNAIPNTLEYTLPKELLPTPDMRQPLLRDPSDPSNFMYDRTLFAPLKSRNRNTPDRVRGDLDIQPIKTGYFDVATVPSVDLAKGYFGYSNDIMEYSDLQDISYERARDRGNGETLQSSQKLSNLLSDLNKNLMKLNPAYATPPPLNFGPLNQNANPWYNSATDTVNSVWAK